METISLLTGEGLVLVGERHRGAVERTVRIWLLVLAGIRVKKEARLVVADIHFPKLRMVECCAVVGAWPFRVCGN